MFKAHNIYINRSLEPKLLVVNESSSRYKLRCKPADLIDKATYTVTEEGEREFLGIKTDMVKGTEVYEFDRSTAYFLTSYFDILSFSTEANSFVAEGINRIYVESVNNNGTFMAKDKPSLVIAKDHEQYQIVKSSIINKYKRLYNAMVG